jgi:hypothetical protein
VAILNVYAVDDPQASVADIAALLGVTERHARRLLGSSVGPSRGHDGGGGHPDR